MITAGVPPRLAQARLSDFPKQAVEKVQNWLLSARDGLLLTGPTGTGKTYLAAAIVRARLELHSTAPAQDSLYVPKEPLLFRSAADLYSQCRATFNSSQKDHESHESEESVLREYFNCKLLLLDDIGAGSLSDFERRVLLDVLDKRWGYLRPTVVTTNLSIDQIAAAMDERIGSRLRSFTVITLTGRDRRART